MPIIEALGQIPPIFYFSAFLLLPAFYGFLLFSKPQKTIAAKAANPADQLKQKKINLKKELKAALSLSLAIACGFGVLSAMGDIVRDYKNDEGLFAENLPASTLPPAPEIVLPPAPPLID